MAYGGVGAVAVAVASALTLLPALLRRVRPPHPARAPTRSRPAAAFGRIARAVQRRPVLVALAGLGLLAVLALPLPDLAIQGVDVRALPADATARRDAQHLERRLPAPGRAPDHHRRRRSAPPTPRLPGYLAQLRGLATSPPPPCAPTSPAGSP